MGGSSRAATSWGDRRNRAGARPCQAVVEVTRYGVTRRVFRAYYLGILILGFVWCCLHSAYHLVGLLTRPLPNTRLKLTAPGCWRNCVCAPTGFVVGSRGGAPTGVGAAA